MKIFDYLDYRDYLKSRLKEMPSRGHGQLAKIAAHLGVHPSLVTQIMRGQKDFHGEQALLIAEYLGMNEIETDYLLLLVDYSRAAHHKLKARLRKKLENIREHIGKAQNRVPAYRELPENEKAVFYSNWFYSAIRLSTDLAGMDNPDAIAQKFGLERKLVKEVVSFLLDSGLLLADGKKLKRGPQRTYLPPDSPFISRHHANWRLKAIENFTALTPAELAFTAPITLAEKDLGKCRKILLDAIEEITVLVDKSPAEKLACLNIDLFKPLK